MPFLFKNIDRAIEWCIRDEMIKRGLWPPQRTFTTDAELQNALAAMQTANLPTVDVFGVGNFVDRSRLKKNNLIIGRSTPTAGETGFAYPYRFELTNAKSFDLIKGAEGSVNLEFEVRFVTFDVAMDRTINEALVRCMRNRKWLHGMNDDLSEMEESFLIQRVGDPIDISKKDYIERVYRYIVLDIVLDEDETVETGVPPMRQIDAIINAAPHGSDVQYPENQNNVETVSSGAKEFFLDLVGGLSAWKKFTTARLYAQETQAGALKDLLQRVNDATNMGLTFTAYEGFKRTAIAQYIDTKFRPDSGYLSSYSYAVFVTEAPGTGIMELFGLIDTVQASSFFIRNDSTSGIQAKGNSDTQLQLTSKVKANTLYVLNRRNINQLEIFEGEDIIGTLEASPTIIPSGKVFDLNIANQAGAPVGVATAGGLAFSAAGEGLRGSDIKELNIILRFYMQKIGLIPV
jgi:hypothetical protein